MLINYKNLEYVNDVQVHDAAFKGLVKSSFHLRLKTIVNRKKL